MQNIQSEFYEYDKKNEYIDDIFNENNKNICNSDMNNNYNMNIHLSEIETLNSSKNNKNCNYISNESSINEYKLNKNNVDKIKINNNNILNVNNINIEENIYNKQKINENFLFHKFENNILDKNKLINLNQNNKQKKKRIQRNKIREEKKKNMGRKRMNENKLRNTHNKLSKDNVIYKMKVKFNKFIYRHLNYYLPNNLKLKTINGTIIKNGNKEFNLWLFKLTIKQFLMNNISSKYKNQVNINNSLLQLIEKNEEINEFLEERYLNGFYKYFLMNKNEYFNKYRFINLFLYDNLELDKEEKKVWDELIYNGLYNYFDKKNKRTTIDYEI